MNLRRLRILFGLIIGLLISLSVWTYWNLKKYGQTVDNIRQTNFALQKVSEVFSLIKDAETGHRGYQLSNDESYLEPYYRADVLLQVELDRLDSISDYLPEISSKVDALRTQVNRQLDIIEQILRATNWKNSSLDEEELRLLNDGKVNMDLIRVVVADISKTARSIVLKEVEDEGEFKNLTPINILVIGLIAFGGVLLLFSRAVQLLQERDEKARGLQAALVELKTESETRVATSTLLRNVLDTSRDGVAAFESVRNPHGEIVDFIYVLVNESATRLARRSEEQLLGQSLMTVFPEHREYLFAEYAKVADGKGDFESEFEFKIDNKLIWFKVLAVKFQDGFVVNFSDITEEKERVIQLQAYTQELKRSNEDLEQFAYVASHDLQEPLRKIRSFGDRLVSKYQQELGDTGKDYIQRMQNAAQRMQFLIEDLLDFSRITRSNELPEKVNLRKVFEDIIEDLSEQIEGEQANLVLGDLPPVLGVYSQVQRLFQNLINNAIKFRKQDHAPLVKINAETFDATQASKLFSFAPRYPYYVKITVSDNGIGFDDKYSDQIFTIFRRLHGKDQFKGTGIGLAICKKIAIHHGGLIQAKSIEGIGSEFIVILPSIDPDTPTK